MIIGLSGYARTGKDTVADILVKEHGFTKVSFADPMREALERLDPFIHVKGAPSMPLSQALRIYSWDELKDLSHDIRGLLQRMGTEVGRGMFGENFWIEYALSNMPKETNVVFSDVRFTDEAQAILSLKGRLWRVERTGVSAANTHVSESELDTFPFELTISNNFSLETLSRVVNTAVNFNALDLLRSL